MQAGLRVLMFLQLLPGVKLQQLAYFDLPAGFVQWQHVRHQDKEHHCLADQQARGYGHKAAIYSFTVGSLSWSLYML